MAANRGGGGGDEAKQVAEELNKTLKEGERILAPTRRPDGTLRKPIRIRAGYVPQDEVAIYQSKGALWKKEMASLQELPPGSDPAMNAKPKTKSVKRNERKKEKRLQAALEKGKNIVPQEGGEMKKEDVLSTEDGSSGLDSLELMESQMSKLSVSTDLSIVTGSSNATEDLNQRDPIMDIDKKIRAVRKKIRLTEAQVQKDAENDRKPGQLDRFAKLEGWREELKLLEEKKVGLAS